MNPSPELVNRAVGRPKESRVTLALFEAALAELSENGFERTTIAAIAGRARTSKQAVYRRFKDKTAMIAAAVEHGFATVRPTASRRGSVAEDLRLCLLDTVSVLQETPLGGAVRALVPYRHVPVLARILEEAEADRRLILRQIFIATPFEADMEARIDLLLGFVHFRLMSRDARIEPGAVETAIYLVLGLVAPRDPSPHAGLPGV